MIALLLALLGPPVLSPTAREQLRDMATFKTEVLGCLVGSDSTVDRVVIVQADGMGTQIERRAACPTGTVGYVHNHPSTERCWYVFPGTYVPTSDGAAAQASPYRFDAIVCGELIVWNTRGDVRVAAL